MIKIGLSTHNFFGEFYSLFKIMYEFYGTNIKLISDITPNEIKNIDILLLSGGEDINPEIYGEKNTNSYINYLRDIIDFRNLKIALQLNKKILGVCRGHQLVNAVLGGKLIQNIVEGHPGSHHLDYAENFKYQISFVNSLHHQGVIFPGENMKSLATYKNVHEITKRNDDKILSVQFHPEFMSYSRGENSNNEILKMLGDFILA